MSFHASKQPQRQQASSQRSGSSHQTSQLHPQPNGPGLREEIQLLQSTVGNQAVAQLLQDEQQLSAQTENLAVSSKDSPPSLAKTPLIQRIQAQTQDQEQVEETGPVEQSIEPQQDHSTPLPAQLQSGVEQLSGLSLSDVRVHYNSSKPAQVDALAYAQGFDIHMGPGQEKHLPHEAWHIVQQLQGRVQPTRRASGAAINDDRSLEQEADIMGRKAVQMQSDSQTETYMPPRTATQRKAATPEGQLYSSPRTMLGSRQNITAPIQRINVGWVPYKTAPWRNVTTIGGFTAATKGGGGFNIANVENDNIANAATGAVPVILPANHMLSDVGGNDLPTYAQAANLTPECDHIVQRAEGGANDLSNARMLSKAENMNPATPRPHAPAYGGAVAETKLKIYTPITMSFTKAYAKTKYGPGPYNLASGAKLSLKQARALARYANGVDPANWAGINRAVIDDIIAAAVGNTTNGIKII